MAKEGFNDIMCQREANESKGGSEATVESPPPTYPPNMLSNASFLSRLFFNWPTPLLKLGITRPLEEIDLPEILEVDSSTYNRNYFDKLWAEERARNPENPSLHRAILRDFIVSIWYVQPLMMMAMIAKIVQAIVLGLLIESFETGNGKGYKWAAILVAGGVITLFEHHHVFVSTQYRQPTNHRNPESYNEAGTHKSNP